MHISNEKNSKEKNNNQMNAEGLWNIGHGSSEFLLHAPIPWRGHSQGGGVGPSNAWLFRAYLVTKLVVVEDLRPLHATNFERERHH